MSAPEWYWREIIEHRFWEIGAPGNRVVVDHLAGLLDVRFAIQHAKWQEVTLLDLPGLTLSHDERAARIAMTRQGIVAPEQDIFVSDNWAGFSADLVADPRALRQYQEELRRLEDEREMAQDTGNHAAACRHQGEIDEINRYLLESRGDQGRPKRLAAGDPLDKAWEAARKRRRRVRGLLRAHGLDEIDDHLRRHLYLQKRTITYCPPPDEEPRWVFEKIRRADEQKSDTAAAGA